MSIRVRLLCSIRPVVALVSVVALLVVLAASPASAAETKTFTGVKGCKAPYSSFTPPAQGGYCLIFESSLRILEGAKVYYWDAHVTSVNGGLVLNSPVILRAVDERGSTAMGHCTYYFATATAPGHGVCDYSGGTEKLDGFHAHVVVGAPTFIGSGIFPLLGTYWFDRD
jgi:hypothetical protein